MSSEPSVLTGKVIVPGRGAIARIATDPEPAERGYILLVGRLTTTDLDRTIRSSGVIVDTGCSCDHAAQICSILGLPVIQLPVASTKLRDGQRVCVDGTTGDIHLDPQYPNVGNWAPDLRESTWTRLQSVRFQVGILGEDCVHAVNELGLANVDQFFVRDEFLWLRRKECPFHSTLVRGIEGTAAAIRDSLLPVADSLQDRQTLNFRSLDSRSDEFHFIIDHQRGKERNPQLGLHGIRHLLKRPELLKAELLAVDALRRTGYENIIFSLPFLTDPAELDAVRRIASAVCTTEPPIGVYVETQAAVYKTGAILQRKPRCLCVGTKDLAQLILACDRTEPSVQDLYDLADPAVIAAVSDVALKCAYASTPIFVYAGLDNVEAFLEHMPHLSGLSVTRGDYQAIATGMSQCGG